MRCPQEEKHVAPASWPQSFSPTLKVKWTKSCTSNSLRSVVYIHLSLSLSLYIYLHICLYTAWYQCTKVHTSCTLSVMVSPYRVSSYTPWHRLGLLSVLLFPAGHSPSRSSKKLAICLPGSSLEEGRIPVPLPLFGQPGGWPGGADAPSLMHIAGSHLTAS
jgi:hypothetical protein